MDITVDNQVAEQAKGALRLRHTLLVYTSPRSLFERVEDTGHYGLALVLLLGLVTLIGYAQIQTGLIDRVVDQQTEQALAALETSQGDLVDRVELRDGMETIRKQGEFNKTMTRLGRSVMLPVSYLASFLLIASVLYAAVALTGRKPEYHTLISICVYAGFLELVGLFVRLAMMLYYRTPEVETSLGFLAPMGEKSILFAIDPFRIWFWILVAIGVAVTHQLSRRMAIVTCTLLCLASIGMHAAIHYAGT